MSDNKTRAFNILSRLSESRDFSAKDLEVRGNFSKPRDILAELRQGGQVERSFRLGREQFYKPVAGAPTPVDARVQAGRVAAAASQGKRKKRALMARARAMRKLKQIKKQRGE